MDTGNTLNPEILKFRKGKFVLQEVASSKLRAKLSKNPHWTGIENDSYVTDNMGAAAVFRRYSDEAVEKLFQKTLQAHYACPKLPQLALDPHQLEGVKWILTRKRSYLAHAPGAGKTAQAIIAACLAQGDGQILFIVPPSLTKNWEREIYKFSPWAGNYSDVAIVPCSNLKDQMNWDAGIIVCPDSMLTKNWVYSQLLNLNKKFIAVDEASRFKESFSGRSLAFYGGKSGDKIYPGLFQKARHVVFLDGSPMPNRPIELWAPTFALHPEAIDYRDYNDFGYRYCGAKPNSRGQWEYLYSSNEEELKTKLQNDFMHVVRESELRHPERLRSMVVMSEDVRTQEHKTWERKNLTAGFEFSDENTQGDLARFRREIGIRKVPWIARYVRERVQEKNESILLFVWHREVAIQLYEKWLGEPEVHSGYKWKGSSVEIVIGGCPEYEREFIFENFQKGITKILIMNIAAGGRGHNLQKADRVIFGEFSWTDEVNKQAEKRASRRGNEKEFVRCEYLVCPNSMDERVLQSVFSKEKRVGRIIG